MYVQFMYIRTYVCMCMCYDHVRMCVHIYGYWNVCTTYHWDISYQENRFIMLFYCTVSLLSGNAFGSNDELCVQQWVLSWAVHTAMSTLLSCAHSNEYTPELYAQQWVLYWAVRTAMSSLLGCAHSNEFTPGLCAQQWVLSWAVCTAMSTLLSCVHSNECSTELCTAMSALLSCTHSNECSPELYTQQWVHSWAVDTAMSALLFLWICSSPAPLPVHKANCL